MDADRHLELRLDAIEKRTDDRHDENQAATQQLSNDFHQMREAIEDRWQRIDQNQNVFERFIDDWEGRPSVGKIGLGVQLRTMLNEWNQLRWGARIVWAIVVMMASAVGYLTARFLESHK